MEEHVSSFAATHLLQHTLRSFCVHQNSQWVYAVFWRILPRNHPPPKWDWEAQGAYDRSRGNRRNWILAWEDGFCNFAASSSVNNGNCEFQQHYQGLQPELFFKMSHEIYNYGEGLIGKVAADHSHKWIYNEPINDQENNLVSAWHNSAESHPRTWEAQFQCGIKTIALIGVREGVLQLGAVQKVIEDLNYVVLLRKKLSYIASIPGVLLPHPSSISSSSSSPSCGCPYKVVEGYGVSEQQWHFHGRFEPQAELLYDQYLKISPSMSSLEALLSKLPSVVPPPAPPPPPTQPESLFLSSQMSLDLMGMQRVGVKEDVEDEEEVYKPLVEGG